MAEVSLSSFYDSLQSTFRRYLFSLTPIADNETQLRHAFWDALGRADAFAREPLLSVIKAYENGDSLAKLIALNLLHKNLSRLPREQLDINRPLYQHQVESVRLASTGQSYVVATGTGSGKTECFLIPILDDVLCNPGPGVRAIVVYPMNALANDQLDRLRRLLVDLPEVSFGRYTGDTAWNISEVDERDEADMLNANERFTRETIRQDPPHILLTNFAMLEYLLLRPGDHDIFRHQRLRFVVLDEAHTYSGAQGIEVSLLMRRLRLAYANRRIQFVLTSATLSDSEKQDSRREVAEFAKQLTGGEFDAANVLLGTVARPFANDVVATPFERYLQMVPDDDALQFWLAALDETREIQSLLQQAEMLAAGSEAETHAGRLLYGAFAKNRELAELHRICSEQPRTLSEVCEHLWSRSDPAALRVMHWLVSVGSRALPTEESAPLVPGRYHFFFRGIPGASVCLAPDCPDRDSHPGTFWGSFILSERIECSHCSLHVMPLSCCFNCGMPAVTVYVGEDRKWQAVPPLAYSHTRVLTWNDIDTDDYSDSEEFSSAFLCLACRDIELEQPPQCCRKHVVVELKSLNHDKEGQLRTCPRCGSFARPYPTVLRSFTSGEDGPTAVLAEAMIRNLPVEDSTKPASGRRLLAFSDSRQRAAHFAPYLMRTTADAQYLRPLLEAIRVAESATNGQGTTIQEVAQRFTQHVCRQTYVALRESNEDGEPITKVKASSRLRGADRRAITNECMISLLQHFTSSGRSRLTIPGLALAAAEIELTEDEENSFRQRFPALFSNEDEAGLCLMQHLLARIAQRKAITFPDGISLRLISDGPQMATYHASAQSQEAGRQRYRWNPFRAPDRSRTRAVRNSYQLAMMEKFTGLSSANDAAKLSTLLDQTWDTFRDTEVLQRTDYPNEFQLDHTRLLLSTNKDWWCCNRCGRFTIHNAHLICPSAECEGTLERKSSLQREERFRNNHRYHRLLESEPIPLIVREHTAQLTNRAGREYQRQFRDCDLNVLSSSTTFEMGVDVGQLKAVLLRNVPPTPASYIQRAGRAGRRREGASYAVTFARTVPHDQFHFHQPLATVSGTVPVPRINLANSRLAQRHVNSLLIGRYMRAKLPAGTDRIAVREFFLDPSEERSLASQMKDWARENYQDLLTDVNAVIPSSCNLNAADAITDSTETLCGNSSVATELQQRLAGYEEQRSQLHSIVVDTQNATDRLEAAKAMKSVEVLRDQLLNESIIDCLSSEHWLPSYAFPQNVVRLLVRQPNWSRRMRLERDGEYGISEYAPGAEVIADGHVFSSAGVDLQHRKLEVRSYRICSSCRTVQIEPSSTAIDPQCTCGAQPQGKLGVPRAFIEPLGFTTVWNASVPEARLFRLKPPPNSEVFLIEGAPAESFTEHPEIPGVTLAYRSDGRLFRANPGRGFNPFRICITCGRSFKPSERPHNHRTPWGSRCASSLIQRVDMAYQFSTDTLQVRFDGVHPEPPPITDRPFWTSLQTTTLAAAAEILSIPQNNLDATHRSQSSDGLGGELVMYDRVPGGAGYVERVREELPEILGLALDRLKHCPNPGCDLEGSCYVCLRTYWNQFQWEHLRRRVVVDWLEAVQ